MQIHQLKVSAQGGSASGGKSRKKPKRRVGRGGKKGTYSGRGMKGQKSRSGASVNPIFEGGRSTLIEHLPKMRGFKSSRPKNQILNIEKIDSRFKDGDAVNPRTLREHGLIRKMNVAVKILGKGEITKKIVVEKCLVSKSAKEKIEAAGGSLRITN